MKKFAAILLIILLGVSSAACVRTPVPLPTPTPTDNRLVECEGLAEDMYPDLDAIDAAEQLTGTVNVNMVFGTTYAGWEAVEKAYEKIQTGVDIVLTNYGDDTYEFAVKQESVNANTDWDIFQGNRVSNASAVAYNLTPKIYGANWYAGSKTWQSVLSTDAYITDKSGNNTSCYIMNSESLSTAWFVNKTAFDAAVGQGYLNAEGEADMPKTWDDLLSLCAALKKAGYTNPLGLAGDEASVNASQFAWLFRVYGDQYYRDMYPNINVQAGDNVYSSSAFPFEFSLNDPQPESDPGYNPSYTRFWNSLLDENNEYNQGKNLSYVGAKSDKFACFIENIYKLREYLPFDFSQISFDTVRDRFMTAKQTEKTKPVILLDYTGFGLTFGLEDYDFEIDFFDYPAMTCAHEEKHVTTDFVRDVGGNGGYLSVMYHRSDAAQDELSIDFLKFFMSPYGQSVYYKALQEKSIAPNGLSTVLNFVVPESWKTFFESDKIAFNGLCDVNWYNNNFIYHINGTSDSRAKHLEVVQNLLKTKTYASADEAIKDFQNNWDGAVREGYGVLCASFNWKSDSWKEPGTNIV